MADQRAIKFAKIPLTGKLNTADDPTTLGPGDFQTLTNMRYGAKSIKSIKGMTKINTAVINATYLKPRSGIHFKKDRPAESHVLVQAFNAGETASKVYENTTAIPSAGAFTATEVWSDATSAEVGKFSRTPNGCIAYANGKETCIWAGTEHRVAQFVNFDPILYAFEQDYTDQVSNSSTATANLATLKRTSNADVMDGNDILLLHLDNNDDDSSTVTKAVVSGSTTYSSATKKFGTHSAEFVAADTDMLTVDYHTDFTCFSTGVWTVDAWIYPNTLGNMGIVGQYEDASNYWMIRTSTTGGIILTKATSGAVLTFITTRAGVITAGAWNHVMVVQDVNHFRCYVNGVLEGYIYSTGRIKDMNDNITIGFSTSSSGVDDYYFDGFIDEVRFCKVAKDGRTVPTQAYGQTAVYYTYVDVCSILPIDRIKFYVSTINATAATAAVYYWSGTAWTTVAALSDGTILTAGKTLTQTGTMTFTSTVSTAKLSYRFGTLGYHYRVIFTGLDDNVVLSQVTVGMPFQALKDLWDGVPVSVSSFLFYSSSIGEYIGQTFTDDYDSTDEYSYCNIGGLTSSQQIYVGFQEKVTGVIFKLGAQNNNSTLSHVSAYYWSGSAWTAVSGQIDYTSGEGKYPSFGQTGAVAWTPPTAESKRSIEGGEYMYFYKFTVDVTLDAAVHIDFVGGITAPRNINAYKYPVMWQDRLFLLNEAEGDKNRIIGSTLNSAIGFNGLDSLDKELGDNSAIIAGQTLFTRFGEGIYDNLVIHKANGQVWIIDGFSPSDYKFYKVSDTSACIAPGTAKSCDLGYVTEEGTKTHVAIWQSSSTICLFDGNSIQDIGEDIANYFDTASSVCITSGKEHLSEAFYDDVAQEYHWLFMSGSGITAINTEMVYSLKYRKWYTASRGTAKALVLGINAIDTNNKRYTYGLVDASYMERLEYGNTFDSISIISTFRTGDISFSGDMIETFVRKLKHISIAKATTTVSATVTHYNNAITTSTDTTSSFALKSTTHRILQTPVSVSWGPGVYHSFNCTATVTDETIGYEPLALLVGIKEIREDLI